MDIRTILGTYGISTGCSKNIHYCQSLTGHPMDTIWGHLLYVHINIFEIQNLYIQGVLKTDVILSKAVKLVHESSKYHNMTYVKYRFQNSSKICFVMNNLFTTYRFLYFLSWQQCRYTLFWKFTNTVVFIC